VRKKIVQKKRKSKGHVAGESFSGKNPTRFGGVGLIRLDPITIPDRRDSPYSPGAMSRYCVLSCWGPSGRAT
jgi:hypothetical protein